MQRAGKAGRDKWPGKPPAGTAQSVPTLNRHAIVPSGGRGNATGEGRIFEGGKRQ